MEAKTNKIQYFLSLGIRDSFNILLGLSSKEAKMNKTNKVCNYWGKIFLQADSYI